VTLAKWEFGFKKDLIGRIRKLNGYSLLLQEGEKEEKGQRGANKVAGGREGREQEPLKSGPEW
jgi:hypothetical protein